MDAVAGAVPGRKERRMTVTTICRVFFHWYEYEAMLKFETENTKFKKIAEDTTGTTYEYRTDYVVGMEGEKNETD